MNRESDKPALLFLNPLAIWTHFALKAGEALLASPHPASARANAPKVAVIPGADAPAPPLKAPRAKVRRKANAKRRTRR
jgi:hypothetical protein